MDRVVAPFTVDIVAPEAVCSAYSKGITAGIRACSKTLTADRKNIIQVRRLWRNGSHHDDFGDD